MKFVVICYSNNRKWIQVSNFYLVKQGKIIETIKSGVGVGEFHPLYSQPPPPLSEFALDVNMQIKDWTLVLGEMAGPRIRIGNIQDESEVSHSATK